MINFKPKVTRRRFLAGTAAVGGTMALGFPAVHAQSRSLKIGTYGGYFEESFVKHIYPGFTAASGIEVESVAEPTGEQWLLQLEQAAKAGVAPADVSMMANTTRLRGATGKLWAPLDASAIGNTKFVEPHFVFKYDDGSLYGVGAVAWYITLVTNTDVYPEAPTSWAEFWDERNRDRLGLLALASNSFLLEITAHTFFGGAKILDTEDGIMKVLEKISEAKPNVKLWYRDEAQFQNALQNGEIPMGQYYHDVAGLAAADGFPVRSTFPKEGGVNDSGAWVVSKASKKTEEAAVFINYVCQPEIQDTLARKVGTAPVVAREHLKLSDEEFAAVSSDIPPIIPRYDLYLDKGDWIAERWTEMITG